MTIFHKANQLSDYLSKQANKVIGFVPTMGALHAGHLSLVETARQHSDIVVSSIFVNPTQFNDLEDFKKYPITIEKDLEQLEKSNCDIVFLPSVNEIYPAGLQSNKIYELGYLEEILEGKYRPGHFQGVCQVVDRLLEIVNPDKLFLGQKDYQQCMVLEKLVSLTCKKTEIIKVPTLRNEGGLALSSRNTLLTEEGRTKAESLHKSLVYIKENVNNSPFEKLESDASAFLLQNGFTKVDYIKIANADDLSPANDGNANGRLVVVAAAYVNNVRLIDNLILTH